MIKWDVKNDRPMRKSPDYTGLTYRQLVEIAKEKGVSYGGLNKAELLKEVESYEPAKNN